MFPCLAKKTGNTLYNVFSAAILVVTLERFSEDADILVDLGHLQEQLSNVGPGATLDIVCLRRDISGMLYTDDVCIVSRSPHGLERMMAVFAEVFGAIGLTISESKTETMCMPIPRAPATQVVFNATGQQYRKTTSFTYLGGTVTETPNQLRDRPADPHGLHELQALHAGAVRPPEG